VIEGSVAYVLKCRVTTTKLQVDSCVHQLINLPTVPCEFITYRDNTLKNRARYQNLVPETCAASGVCVVLS